MSLFTLELTPWERAQLHAKVNAELISYLGHYHDAGLFHREIEKLNALRRLEAKLSEDPVPEDLPYRGLRRNGFNPEQD